MKLPNVIVATLNVTAKNVPVAKTALVPDAPVVAVAANNTPGSSGTPGVTGSMATPGICRVEE